MKTEILSVLDNQFNHSKRVENENGETCTQLKYKFRTHPKVTYEGTEMYEERFKSFLMYEWSKRKEEGEAFNMWVSCLVVQNQYIHRYDDVFLFDENETQLLQKAQGLFKILNHFYFPDVEVYFFVEDGDDKREERMHLIEDVMRMIQEDFLVTYNFCSIIEEKEEKEEKEEN